MEYATSVSAAVDACPALSAFLAEDTLSVVNASVPALLGNVTDISEVCDAFCLILIVRSLVNIPFHKILFASADKTGGLLNDVSENVALLLNVTDCANVTVLLNVQGVVNEANSVRKVVKSTLDKN